MKIYVFPLVLLMTTLGSIYCDDFHMVDELIQGCHNDFYDRNPCPDYPGMEICLNNILKEHPKNRAQLDQRFAYVKSELNTCPALTKIGSCIQMEIEQCTKDVYNHYTEQCVYVNKAIACMKKLNVTCQNYKIEDNHRAMQELQRKCDAGLYGNGPCNEKHFYKCTEALYSSYSYNEHGYLTYDCREEDITSAKRCLSQIGKKCIGDIHKDILTTQLDGVKYNCEQDKSTSSEGSGYIPDGSVYGPEGSGNDPGNNGE